MACKSSNPRSNQGIFGTEGEVKDYKPKPFEYSIRLFKSEIKILEKYIKNQNKKGIALVCNEKAIIKEFKSTLSILESRQMDDFLKEHRLSRNDLKKLTKRELRILELRANAWSLEEIGKDENICQLVPRQPPSTSGLTRERIRQIEAKAIRKLGLLQYFPSLRKYHSPFVRRIK